MKSQRSVPIIASAVLLLLVSLACGLAGGAPSVPPTEAYVPPPQNPTPMPPTAAPPEPTVVPPTEAPPPTEASQQFFTEEFHLVSCFDSCAAKRNLPNENLPLQ